MRQGKESGGPQSVPLYSTIYKILGNAIQVGALKPGIVLLENPLAEAFGASKLPVRQALRLLERDGLVRRFSGRGLMVGRLDVLPKKLDVSQLNIKPLSDRPPSWQSISDEVERVIINRAICGPSRLNEVGLARYYQIGRTVAHSLLTRLASVGIIDKDTSLRWNIVALDERRLNNLFEIRELLEPLAFSYAIPRIEPARMLRYRSEHEQALKIYPLIPTSELERLEHQLHIELVEECDNRELLEMLHRTHSIFSLNKQLLLLDSQLPTTDPFLAEHIEIVAAVQRGSDGPSQAVQLLKRHINMSRIRLVEQLPTLRGGLTPIDLPYLSDGPASTRSLTWPAPRKSMVAVEGS